MKRVFTTGEVARFCHVTINTVVKWFETGEMKGYKIPQSGARRVPREELVKFMRRNGFPLNGVVSGKTKILVVDDQQAIRALFKKAFPSSEGYEVVEASSGFEAGLLVRKTFPDVIFLDMVLSDIDGREVCRLIRKNPADAKTKIVAISGAISDEEACELKKQGFNDYLKKPFAMEELRKCVAGKRSETIHSSTSRSVLNQQAEKPTS